ncbi:MAG: hypothetical protein AAB622_00645 [Patescibacteria group bacterium]
MNLPFPLHIPDYLAKLGITAELNEAISFWGLVVFLVLSAVMLVVALIIVHKKRIVAEYLGILALFSVIVAFMLATSGFVALIGLAVGVVAFVWALGQSNPWIMR